MPTGSLILLSDGSDLKLHSRGSWSISTPLRYRTTLHRSRIPVVDYAGSQPDVVTVTWLQPPHVVFGSLHLTTRNLTQTRAHSFPFAVTHLAVDRSSCQREVLLVAQDNDTIWKFDANNEQLTPLIRDVDNVSRVFAVNGDVYWIEGRRCLYRREILSHDSGSHNVTCLSSTSPLTAVFVSHAGHDNAVYLLTSLGDVYFMEDGSPMVKIIAAEEYKDRKILKTQMNDFDSLYVTSSPESAQDVQVLVGIKNHGILLEISMHCSGVRPIRGCDILSIKDEINENRLYDFKLLADPGINCSDDVNTIRTQVLIDRTRLLTYSPFVAGRMRMTTWMVVISVVLCCLFLIAILKLVVGLYTTNRADGKRLGDLLSRSARHQSDRHGILRRSASINSVAPHLLKFPPKAVLQASPALAAIAPLPKAISIEDLTGFENPSFNGQRNRTASQKSCGSCDYKEECRDLGICLSTYSLLRH